MSESSTSNDGLGPRALEARLLAPCCWKGTLDVHESEVARTLRHEIEARFDAGESAQTIQDELVERFGLQVVANPSGKPMVALGLVLSAVVIAGGLLVVALLRRWVRAGNRKQEPPSPGGRSIDASDEAELDARLDRELRSLD
jgi:cytochrome c-type biogenesis protein CcmH